MRIAFEEPAIERPTGSMWDRPRGVVGWIASTRLTVRPSKTFTSIRCSPMQDKGYAGIPLGKSIRKTFTISAFDTPNLQGVTIEQLLAMSDEDLAIAPAPYL